MFGFPRKKEQFYGNIICIVNGRLELFSIDDETEGRISAGGMLLPLTEGIEYFSNTGDRYIVFNLDIPALVEAQTLSKIRESEVLKGLFDVQQPKKIMDLLPMIILGVVAFFAVVIR